MKKCRGITLIALVITIIVLLILAGVSLSLIAGENGILKRATGAVSQNRKATAEEELKLVLNEWWMEKVTGTKNLEEFLDEKVESHEIDDYQIGEERVEIYRNGYYVVLDLEGNIVEEIQKYRHKTEATYEVISSSGNNATVKIVIKNEEGIQKITCPNGEVIEGNGQTEVEIEQYDVENEQSYPFKIQIQEEEETFVLDFKTASLITIEGTTEAYPVLTKTGIEKVVTFITIQYPENEKCYYSLDEGKTWLRYKEGIVTEEPGKIMAKSVLANKIVRIETKEIAINRASDALGEVAYDGKEETCVGVGSAYILLDEEVRGELLYVSHFGSYQYSGSKGSSVVKFLDANRSEIPDATYGVESGYGFKGNRPIPSNAVWVQFFTTGWASSCVVYEVGFSTMPSFDETQMIPYMDSVGVHRKTKYKISYHERAVEKFYSKDKVEWKEYPEEGVELNNGETLYAKSTNLDGKESQIMEYTHHVAIIDEKAYDNDPETYYNCVNGGVNHYIYIDPSLGGRTVYFKFIGAGKQ